MPEKFLVGYMDEKSIPILKNFVLNICKNNNKIRRFLCLGSGDARIEKIIKEYLTCNNICGIQMYFTDIMPKGNVDNGVQALDHVEALKRYGKQVDVILSIYPYLNDYKFTDAINNSDCTAKLIIIASYKYDIIEMLMRNDQFLLKTYDILPESPARLANDDLVLVYTINDDPCRKDKGKDFIKIYTHGGQVTLSRVSLTIIKDYMAVICDLYYVKKIFCIEVTKPVVNGKVNTSMNDVIDEIGNHLKEKVHNVEMISSYVEYIDSENFNLVAQGYNKNSSDTIFYLFPSDELFYRYIHKLSAKVIIIITSLEGIKGTNYNIDGYNAWKPVKLCTNDLMRIYERVIVS